MSVEAQERPEELQDHFGSSCVRCPLLRVHPNQRQRLIDIRDNLQARISEAEREGWAGEAEGLRVSLAAANDELAQVDKAIRRRDTAIELGMPSFPQIAGGTVTTSTTRLASQKWRWSTGQFP